MARRLGTRQTLARKMAMGQGFRVKTAGDTRVCDFCRSKHGKYQNGGTTPPPYHPNCRCAA